MSATLSDFLDKPEGPVAKFINTAEKLTGCPSEDARLISEIAAQLKPKISSLGLDHSDTEDKELYYALQSKAQTNNPSFGLTYGFNKNQDHIKTLEDIFRHSY